MKLRVIIALSVFMCIFLISSGTSFAVNMNDGSAVDEELQSVSHDIVPPEPVQPQPVQLKPVPPESVSPEEVIPSYGLDDEQTKQLIQLHKNASSIDNPTERLKAYTEICESFKMDYLAQFCAGLAEFERENYFEAWKWFLESCYNEHAPDRFYAPADEWRQKAHQKYISSENSLP